MADTPGKSLCIKRSGTAWDATKQVRAEIWEKKKIPVPIAAEQRRLILAAHRGALQKTSLDTAWQRPVTQAIEKGVMTAEQRFGLHDFKRRGITDTGGTRADKQQASGHRSERMLDVYVLSAPVVNPAAE